MATLALLFNKAVAQRDYHMAAGYVSPQFNQLIDVTLIDNTNTATRWRADDAAVLGAGVTIAFTAVLLKQPVGNQPLSVDPKTGELVVPHILPALTNGSWPQEMIITCSASGASAPSVSIGVRIWIHKEVYRIWVTPSSLTLRRAANNVRCSLLGKFTDGVFADLSNWSPLTQPQTGPSDQRFVRYRPIGLPGAGTQPVVLWERSGSGLGVHPQTGILECTSATANGSVSAKLQTFATTTISSLPATLSGAPEWSSPTEVIPLREKVDDFKYMKVKRNVLFLPDGYGGEDGKKEFLKTAAELVRRLADLPATRPYDLLKDRFNYFYAWVNSPQSDISVLNELGRSRYSGPTYTGPGVPCEADEVTLPPALRFLANEQNTAFHAAIGQRPAATGPNLWPFFHPFRLDWEDFNAFLNGLHAIPAVADVPKVWARNGVDSKLIVILCRTRRGDGLNQVTSLIQHGQRAVFLPVQANDKGYYLDNGKSYDVLAAASPTSTDDLISWGTLAHELSHSFNLDDEYSTGDKKPLDPIERDMIDASPNTQRLETLVDSSKHIDVTKIKWDWTRIRKACDYEKLVRSDPAGKKFICTLNKDYKLLKDKRDKFNKDEIVWLRKRDLVTGGHIFAGPLKIDEKVTALEVKLSFQFAGGSMPTDFFDPASSGPAPPGVLLMREKVGAFDVDIIHSLISAQMSNGNPSNASLGDSPHTACSKGSALSPTTPTNVPTSGVTLPAQKFLMVGLYESGHRRNCGVYHPSGACTMNVQRFTDASGFQIRPFCHVCRYGLVDQIDPRMHGAIDRDYAKVYPK